MTEQKTILYAEDDAVTLTAYRNRLEKEGFIVHAATDGLEALKWLHLSPPDLILLDLMLPKFSGEEILKYLTENPALGMIPVIILSTNSILTAANEPLVEKAEKHFLKHDCTYPKLLAAIQELLAENKASAQAGRMARMAKSNHEANHPSSPRNQIPEATDSATTDSLIAEIRKMQNRAPLVCAWTDRINVEGKWMNLTEFLSERLHLTVTHGVSPEGRRKFFGSENV